MIAPQSVIEDGLAAAARRGADACIVLVEEGSEADVRFALNMTTTNGVRRDRSVTVLAFLGGSVGMARRGGLVDVEEMVAAALRDAREAPPSDDAFTLVDGLGAGRSLVGAALSFGDAASVVDLSELGGVVSGLAGAFARAESAGVVLAGFGEFGVATTYLGSSTGVRLSFAQPTGALQVIGRSGTRSAWAGAGAAAMGSLSLEALEDEVRRRLEWAQHTVSLDAGRYEVIMPPSGVADLMISLYFYGLVGQDAEDGRTVFSAPNGSGAGATRVGEQLSSTPFTLYSDPIEPGVECLPFVAVGSSGTDHSVFDNGLPCGRVEWVREGRLAQLRYHRAGAARSGVEVAPFVDNLMLRAGGGGGAEGVSVDDMVARTERGLLLTCLWYIREVDPSTFLMTGLTRDGVYIIEDGKVVGAANNFRFNESPVDLLARTSEVGASVRTLGREFGEYLNRVVMPPLRIPDFNMSSVSPAS